MSWALKNGLVYNGHLRHKHRQTDGNHCGPWLKLLLLTLQIFLVNSYVSPKPCFGSSSSMRSLFTVVISSSTALSETIATLKASCSCQL